MRWWLLAHQLPPKPDYFRVKIGRRLQRLGAVALKNSVYALPFGEQAHQDLEWLLREIREGGGEGTLFEARLADGLTDAEVIALFRRHRDQDFKALTGEVQRCVRALSSAKGAVAGRSKAEADLPRLTRRLLALDAIDYFKAPGRAAVEKALGRFASTLSRGRRAESSLRPDEVGYRGRTWVTRLGVGIDRIASAWLIRRFIDPRAKFKFVEAKGYAPRKGELRFDMFEAEFTHEGDRCTFEVLLQRRKLKEPALRRLAEIIHDIDLKDGKFGRDEASGVGALIDGICRAHSGDEARLERGSALLDDLFAGFGKRKR